MVSDDPEQHAVPEPPATTATASVGAAPARGARLREAAVALAVAVLTVMVFARSIPGEFLIEWDDGGSIIDNQHIRTIDAASLRWMFLDIEYAPRYMPLSWLSLALSYGAVGLDPVVFRALNVLLHAACAAALFLLVRRLLDRAGPSPPRVATAAAAAGALAWSLHPLRTEVVGWPLIRSYPQALLFLLVALLLYLRAVDRPRPMRSPAYAGSVVSFAVAMFTCPIVLMGFVLPFILDVYPLRRARPLSPRLPEKLPYVALSGLVIALTLATRLLAKNINAPPPTLAEFPLDARVMQAAYILACYVWRFFVLVGLSPVYPTLLDFNPWAPVFVGSMLFVAAATVGALARPVRRKLPLLGALWVAHGALLVTSLGLTERPYHANDRYSYVQGLVFAVAVAAALRAAWLDGTLRPGTRRLVSGAAAVALVLFALASVRQAAVWTNQRSLYAQMLSVLGAHPYAADLHVRIGQGELARGHPATALAHFEAAGAIAPDQLAWRERRAVALLRLGRFREAAADLEALGDRRDPADDYFLAVARAAQGDINGARAMAEHALAREPRFVAAAELLAHLSKATGDVPAPSPQGRQSAE